MPYSKKSVSYDVNCTSVFVPFNFNQQYKPVLIRTEGGHVRAVGPRVDGLTDGDKKRWDEVLKTIHKPASRTELRLVVSWGERDYEDGDPAELVDGTLSVYMDPADPAILSQSFDAPLFVGAPVDPWTQLVDAAADAIDKELGTLKEKQLWKCAGVWFIAPTCKPKTTKALAGTPLLVPQYGANVKRMIKIFEFLWAALEHEDTQSIMSRVNQIQHADKWDPEASKEYSRRACQGTDCDRIWLDDMTCFAASFIAIQGVEDLGTRELMRAVFLPEEEDRELEPVLIESKPSSQTEEEKSMNNVIEPAQILSARFDDVVDVNVKSVPVRVHVNWGGLGEGFVELYPDGLNHGVRLTLRETAPSGAVDAWDEFKHRLAQAGGCSGLTANYTHAFKYVSIHYNSDSANFHASLATASYKQVNGTIVCGDFIPFDSVWVEAEAVVNYYGTDSEEYYVQAGDIEAPVTFGSPLMFKTEEGDLYRVDFDDDNSSADRGEWTQFKLRVDRICRTAEKREADFMVFTAGDCVREIRFRSSYPTQSFAPVRGSLKLTIVK